MHVKEAIKTGLWITKERIHAYSLIILVLGTAGLGYVIITSNGLTDQWNRPLGTDFANIYSAGRYVLMGEATAPFDPEKQFHLQKQIFGTQDSFFGWHYPPFFLIIAALLALLPYASALLIWQASTLPLYLLTIKKILPSSTALMPALAFPAVLINIGHGHNGFLSAALLGSAFLTLEKRPILAGIFLGLLSYKPQFGILIPFALIAGGYWRTIVSASATLIILIITTTYLLGHEIWPAFFHSLSFTRETVLEQGGTGWHKIQSIFAWARMWGAGREIAYALQITTISLLLVTQIKIWRSSCLFEYKAASLIIASLLATPYILDYDLVILAPALALLTHAGLQNKFSPYEKTGLALIWAMPLIARATAQLIFIPLGTIMMLWIYIIICFKIFHLASSRQTII